MLGRTGQDAVMTWRGMLAVPPYAPKHVGGCWSRPSEHQQLQQRSRPALPSPLLTSSSVYIEQCIVPDCTMSSGNPFRTSLAPAQAPSSPVPPTSFTSPETRRPEAGTQHDDGRPLRCVSDCLPAVE